jgi:hypothetical protein
VWVGYKALAAFRKSTDTSITVWQQAKLKLTTEFANTITMKKMLDQIRNPESEKLLHIVLHQTSPYRLNIEEMKCGKLLATNGAVVMNSNDNTIQASAPIIQQVILFSILHL